MALGTTFVATGLPSVALAEGAEDSSSPKGRGGSQLSVFTPEQMLREEIRALRELTFKIIQWGVTVMVATLTALFYARRAFRDDLVALGRLEQGEQLPLSVYCIGTAFLICVALVFSFLTFIAQKRTAHFRSQLRTVGLSGITEPTMRPVARYVMTALYLMFPVLDMAARLALFELSIT